MMIAPSCGRTNDVLTAGEVEARPTGYDEVWVAVMAAP
jgi:hypothetical protein